VGGFGSLFDALVSPDIRAYNRIVVFVAFFSLYSAGTLLLRVRACLPARLAGGRVGTGAALLLLLGAGIADQVPLGALAAIRSQSAPAFSEVDAFVSHIEARLTPGAMVFQLPHESIPVDRSRRRQMRLYDGGRPYFSSRTLRWSWGSMVGRSGDWQMLVARLPPVSLARTLALAGFSGIWIDRLGYSSEGEATRLEAALEQTTSGRVEASDGGRYSFLDLRSYRRLLESSLPKPVFAAVRLRALTPPFRLRWQEGCSEERASLRSSRTGCGASASGVIRNPLLHAVHLRISGQVRSRRPGRVMIDAGGSTKTLDVDAAPTAYEQDVTIGAGRPLSVRISFDGPCPDAGNDTCIELIDLLALPIAGNGHERGGS
jgi:hypothetical protein